MSENSFVRGFGKTVVEPWTDKVAVKKAEERREDDRKAEAAKQIGIAAGASKDAPLVESAQTVARKLGVNGVVTIDDVVREMERLGWTNLRGEEGKKAKNWKGSVFASSEWVCVGSISSRDATAHGRHVRQWALKSWLRKNPVNGTNSEASAFSLWSIYQEAAHYYAAGEQLAFLIGKNMLDASFSDLSDSIKYDKSGTVVRVVKQLYGCNLYFMNGIGAIAMPERALLPEMRQVALKLKERALLTEMQQVALKLKET